MTERKELEHLTPLFEALAEKDFAGYVEQDSYGNLVITIPGVASIYDKIGAHPVEQ